MSLLKLLKKFLFIQNFLPPLLLRVYHHIWNLLLENIQRLKNLCILQLNDKTTGSYIEFGIFTGSSFNFAMKVNKNTKAFRN